METCVFSKHLQEYDFDTLAGVVKEIGAEGVDLTVRQGGHVEPEQVRDKLPEAVAALRAGGIRVSMITTGIMSVDDEHAVATLETAAAEGITHYKIGYYRYGEFGTIRKLMAESKARMRELASLSGELGIFGGYHNHSGPFLGGNLLHVKELIEDLDPEAVGLYLDIGHAFLDGLVAAWKSGIDELLPRIRMLALKDMVVDPEFPVWRARVRPMGQGVVLWEEVLSLLVGIEDRIGPVSVHGEFEEPAEHVAKLMRDDLRFFKQTWAKAKKGE